LSYTAKYEINKTILHKMCLNCVYNFNNNNNNNNNNFNIIN